MTFHTFSPHYVHQVSPHPGVSGFAFPLCCTGGDKSWRNLPILTRKFLLGQQAWCAVLNLARLQDSPSNTRQFSSQWLEAMLWFMIIIPFITACWWNTMRVNWTITAPWSFSSPSAQFIFVWIQEPWLEKMTWLILSLSMNNGVFKKLLRTLSVTAKSMRKRRTINRNWKGNSFPEWQLSDELLLKTKVGWKVHYLLCNFKANF